MSTSSGKLRNLCAVSLNGCALTRAVMSNATLRIVRDRLGKEPENFFTNLGPHSGCTETFLRLGKCEEKSRTRAGLRWIDAARPLKVD